MGFVNTFFLKKIEGSFRSHQVPLLVDEKHPENIIALENWLRSYKIEEFFDKDGKLNRQKLGQEVFAKKERLEQLNQIVYQFVGPEVERRLNSAGDSLYAIDAINLLEGGFDRLCDRTIAVTAPTELRVQRIMARDGISEQYARLRVSAQKPDEYYRSKCDFELNNAAETPDGFRKEARIFFSRLIESITEEKRCSGK